MRGGGLIVGRGGVGSPRGEEGGDSLLQHFSIKGFAEIIVCAGAERFGGDVRAVEGSENHDRRGRKGVPKLREKRRDRGSVSEEIIQNDQIGSDIADHLARLRGVLSPHHVVGRIERYFNSVKDRTVVIDDQNASHALREERSVAITFPYSFQYCVSARETCV